MSENNNEEKVILDDNNNEEAAEGVLEENLEENYEVTDKGSQEEKDGQKSLFIENLMTAIIDVAASGIVSVAVLYIIEGLLTLNGYYISQKINMLLIIFVVVSILYHSIKGTIRDKKRI